MSTVSTRSKSRADWNVPGFWRMSLAIDRASAGPDARPRGLLRTALMALVEADRRYRERVAFSRLPEHLRRDMGLPLESLRSRDPRW